jgi:hypothetical protein
MLVPVRVAASAKLEFGPELDFQEFKFAKLQAALSSPPGGIPIRYT